MGLFNRGSKSDVPLSGDEWSSNGHAPKRSDGETRDEIERQPAPAPEPEREPETIERPQSADEPQADDPAAIEETEVTHQQRPVAETPEPVEETPPAAATTEVETEAKTETE